MTDERLTLIGLNAKIEGHEDVCAERYKGIASEMKGIRADIAATQVAHKETVKEIKGALKWAGSLTVTLLLAVAGWGITQQFNAVQSDRSTERAQRDAERAQISLMQSQMSTFAASLKGSPVAVNVQPATVPGLGPSDPAATPAN